MKIWKLKPNIPTELEEVYKDYPVLLRQLLFDRGLKEPEEIKKFINADYTTGLNSPFLFRDMEKAVNRIWQAIENKEKITIYGDYDADAITANAVLRQAFNYLGADCESYIPDRFLEGYGVNLDALKKIKEHGSKVIITVDCGTNSVDAAEWCKENNIDLIITDHHEIIGNLPNALALINPKNQDDNYPDDQIVGVGVAFKLAQALLQNPKSDPPAGGRNPKSSQGWEKWLLDLVAIGTVADCHKLIGENRIFVKYGLKVLAKTKWVGLRALMDLAKLDPAKQPLDTYSLGFVIAPRLNAAGRLEHANIALELLLENDPLKAKIQAQNIEEINLRRQEITARIMSEAREKAQGILHRKVLVLMGESWHKGVVGLVAGKLAEEFYKPTIVLEKGEFEATGSARSAGEFNVVEALKYSGQHLIRYGGHKQAAGLTLQTENFEIFYQSVLDFAEKNMEEDDGPVLYLDAELSAEDLQFATYNLIASLEPFGVGNPKPKFLLKNAKILSKRAVGQKAQHLQMKISLGNRQISCIAFNFGPKDSSLQIGQELDLACELLQDDWNGNTQLKLRIIDIRQLSS
jgi:single-stranded-DNA-specific exonuclease